MNKKKLKKKEVSNFQPDPFLFVPGAIIIVRDSSGKKILRHEELEEIIKFSPLDNEITLIIAGSRKISCQLLSLNADRQIIEVTET